VNKTVVIIGLLMIAIVGYVAVGPFVTIDEIKMGIKDHDSEMLAANIDFPALRENLKEQLNAYVMKQASTELQDNPFEALGMAIGGKMVDAAVDASVTPSGLAILAAGKKPQQATAGSRSSGREQELEPFKNARYSYDGLSKFSAWVGDDVGGQFRFVLTRDGLSWKLTNIVLPIGVESSTGVGAGSTATSSAGTSASAPTSSSSLKIEAVDTRATEINDVWARFGWKLTASNSGGEPVRFNVRIEWQDADGFVIDHDDEFNLSLDAHEAHVFTGDKLIDYPAASRVSKIEAKIAP